MTLQRLRRQVPGPAGTHGTEKVGEVRRFQCPCAAVVLDVLNLLSLLIKKRSAVGVAGEIAAFTIDDDPVILVAELSDGILGLVLAHIADFADEGSGLIIEKSNLSIGRLPAVIEGKAAPDAYSARRRLVLAQSPAADIDHMNPIISHFTIASVPKPMPFIMQLFAHQRSFGRRTAPELVIDCCRGWSRRADFADAVTGPIHQGMRKTDFAQLAAAQVIKDLAQQRARTVLCAHLHDPSIFSRGGH